MKDLSRMVMLTVLCICLTLNYDVFRSMSFSSEKSIIVFLDKCKHVVSQDCFKTVYYDKGMKNMH